MRKVVFLDSVHEILWERLEKKGFQCLRAIDLDEQSVKELIKDAFGIVIRSRFQLNEDFLKKCNQLQFIARSGSGLENIDSNYCDRNGIAVFNSPEGNRNAVAEHALGMLLSLFNKINKADCEVRQGIWDREGNRGIELDGKTVGIIGFGNNGSSFAKKLVGFDCKILVYDKYKSGFSQGRVVESTLEEIFGQADVVSFHIPQNHETVYFMNDFFISQMKKPFYLLNLSRGKIVKTSSLVNGLKSGKVLGACLDVLEYESSSFSTSFKDPLPEDLQYLFQSDKLLFSPHVAGWTDESYYKLSSVLANKIEEKFCNEN
ncbi:MAG: phosphoglycerate dehydrogenase [Bacteroidetes bacterium]|nr:phosphoglycerate dehydrogenase [Bacteroidota bacterium]